MSDRKVNIENLQKQYELHKEECEKQEREHLHSQIRRWRDEIGNSADVMLQTSAEVSESRLHYQMIRIRSKLMFRILLVSIPIITLVLLFGSTMEIWQSPEIVGIVEADTEEIALKSLVIHLVDSDGKLTVAFPDSSGAFRINATRSRVRRFTMMGDGCASSTLSLYSNDRKLCSIKVVICTTNLNTDQLPAVQLVHIGVNVDRILTNQRLINRQFFDSLTLGEWEKFQTEFHESEKQNSVNADTKVDQ